MKIACLDGKPEIFRSYQGEGKCIGEKRVFVRTSLCNLKCVWCDTKYTWDFDHYSRDTEIIEMAPALVAMCVAACFCDSLVVTGGEPMLQQRELAEMLFILREERLIRWCEVETNGTILPKPEFDALVNQYNVSPKTTNSGNPKFFRDKRLSMLFFAQSEKSVFKFVVAHGSDMGDIYAVVSKYRLEASRVYLMAEAATIEELAIREDLVRMLAHANGFLYTDRRHIREFGGVRGK